MTVLIQGVAVLDVIFLKCIIRQKNFGNWRQGTHILPQQGKTLCTEELLIVGWGNSENWIHSPTVLLRANFVSAAANGDDRKGLENNYALQRVPLQATFSICKIVFIFHDGRMRGWNTGWLGFIQQRCCLCHGGLLRCESEMDQDEKGHNAVQAGKMAGERNLPGNRSICMFMQVIEILFRMGQSIKQRRI